jgi:hypothetical protein
MSEPFVRVDTKQIRAGADDFRGLADVAGSFAGRLADHDPLQHCGPAGDRLADGFRSAWARAGGSDAVEAVRVLPDALRTQASELEVVAAEFDKADENAAERAGNALRAVGGE